MVFPQGFVEVDDGDWSEFVLTYNRGRVVTAKKFIIANTMSAETSGTPEFTNTSAASKGPNRSISKSNNTVRVMSEDFVAKAIEFS
mgnify:CR=1 FL=1